MEPPNNGWNGWKWNNWHITGTVHKFKYKNRFKPIIDFLARGTINLDGYRHINTPASLLETLQKHVPGSLRCEELGWFQKTSIYTGCNASNECGTGFRAIFKFINGWG